MRCYTLSSPPPKAFERWRWRCDVVWAREDVLGRSDGVWLALCPDSGGERMAGHLQDVPHHAAPPHDTSLTHALDFVTPEDALSSNKPDASRLRALYCRAPVHPENMCGKLDARSLIGAFLGAAYSMAYRLILVNDGAPTAPDGNASAATPPLATSFLITQAVIDVIFCNTRRSHPVPPRQDPDAILRSSLYSHFSESLTGIATSRAYKEEDRFLKENRDQIDVENRAYWMAVVNLVCRFSSFNGFVRLSLEVAMARYTA